MPRSASGLRNSGSKTICPSSSATNPACLGIPNLLLKGERKYAIGFISIFTNYYTLIIYKTKKGMNYFAVCTK